MPQKSRLERSKIGPMPTPHGVARKQIVHGLPLQEAGSIETTPPLLKERLVFHSRPRSSPEKTSPGASNSLVYCNRRSANSVTSRLIDNPRFQHRNRARRFAR